MPRKLIDDEDRLIRGSTSFTEKLDARRETAEREGISWRDKDRMKDRSAHTTQDSRERPQPAAVGPNRFVAEQARKANLAAADALFANPARDALASKLLNATPATLEAMGRSYVEQHGFPDSVDLLARLLEHPSAELVRGALEKLEPLMASAPPAKKNQLIQSVKLMSLAAKDPAVRKAAAGFVRRTQGNHVSS